jgi:hypothetical protein
MESVLHLCMVCIINKCQYLFLIFDVEYCFDSIDICMCFVSFYALLSSALGIYKCSMHYLYKCSIVFSVFNRDATDSTLDFISEQYVTGIVPLM